MKHVAVIGAGPAGLMAAEVLADAGMRVGVYEKMPSAGRKFLMAGRGGLNLTHSEAFATFASRYAEASPHVRAALEAYPPQALRDFAAALGEPTFVGSSGRVFPKSLKASPLLRAWLRRLAAQGVAFHFRHRWQGWAGDALAFDTPSGAATIEADATVLALGGASWPRLGADGAWQPALTAAGVATTPLAPANGGILIAWSDKLRAFAGTPLKRIALACEMRSVRGEAVVTAQGLEGGAVYALSADIRRSLARGPAMVTLSLRPDMSEADIAARLSRPRGKQSISSFLRKALALAPVAISLLHEAALGREQRIADLSTVELARLVNALPLRVAGLAPIERAISTAGGVAFEGVDENFMLQARPGVFVAGEMLDWEAPTGGYLLQACFATGYAAGQGAARWLRSMKLE